MVDRPPNVDDFFGQDPPIVAKDDLQDVQDIVPVPSSPASSPAFSEMEGKDGHFSRLSDSPVSRRLR